MDNVKTKSCKYIYFMLNSKFRFSIMYKHWNIRLFWNYSVGWQIMVNPRTFPAFLFRYPWIDFPLYYWPPQSVFIVSIVNGPVPSNDILENWMADGDPQNHLTFIYLDKTSSFDSQSLYCILILWIDIIAIWVVEFQREGYKIKKVFG